MDEYIKNSESFNQFNKVSLDLVQTFFKACETVSVFNKAPDADWQEAFNISESFQTWFGELLHHPESLIQAQAVFFQEYAALCKNVQEKLINNATQPFNAQVDRRFQAKSWQEHPAFYFLQQSYLLFTKHCLKFIEAHPSRSPKLTKQINFFGKNYLDALSPTNFIFTNPEVIEQTLKSNGENLAQGMKNYFSDWINGEGHFNIAMTDMSAFEVGKNIAITPGRVVFQNEMMELIQYDPQTEQVYEKPLLVIPPWINKYYILDLQPKNSFINWIVNQGFTVFVISWVNPDESYHDTGLDNYLFNGLLQAIDVILKISKSETMNALGFCIGGTLLAIASAYMKAKGDQRLASATFLTTLIDYAEAGDLQAFIDDKQLKSLQERMDQEGFLDGRFLMTTFNLLRPNDLVWPYFINNYLCGKKPVPFDLLYWNCDSSNLPKKMITEYLQNMYFRNMLANDAFKIGDETIKLKTVEIPTYFLSTENDHIAPWQSTYLGAQLFQNVTYVLGGAGHIAGVVNPPAAQRYTYRTCKKSIRQIPTSEAWFDLSQVHAGSWWVHWSEWLKLHSGQMFNPDQVLKQTPSLKKAPGSYVRRRLHKL